MENMKGSNKATENMFMTFMFELSSYIDKGVKLTFSHDEHCTL